MSYLVLCVSQVVSSVGIRYNVFFKSDRGRTEPKCVQQPLHNNVGPVVADLAAVSVVAVGDGYRAARRVACTTSTILYPTMRRNKHDWSTSLERTFFTFIIFAVCEILTDIYVVYKLRKQEEFEYYLRMSGLGILTVGWIVSVAFVIPTQLELAYDEWTVMSYNSLLTWNWFRTAVWAIRFSMVVFNVVCEIREEEPIALPKRRENGYVSSLDQKNDVFTFEDSDE